MFRRVLLVTLGGAVLLTVLGPPAATPAPAASMTFTVNTTDMLDDGTCDATHCSLIEAWKASEPPGGNPGKDTIAFGIGIPGSGPHTIAGGARLDFFDSAGVVIDGRTQGGTNYTGPPLIVIDDTGNSEADFVIHGAESTVQGLVIHGGAAAIIFSEENAGGNVVEGNFIGTDLNGMTAVPTSAGVVAFGGDKNTIGGTTPAARNVIVVSGDTAVSLGPGSENKVQGNFIGTDRDGARPLGAGGIVRVLGDHAIVGGSRTSSGGPCNEACNLIVGGGVAVGGDRASSNSNMVQGNFIGTDVNGTAKLGFGTLELTGNDSLLGGADPGQGNVIAGGVAAGFPDFTVLINGDRNRVEGNRIGTDVNGENTDVNGENLGNGGGLVIAGNGNQVGGAAGSLPGGACTGACNLVSGNLFGVSLGTGGGGSTVPSSGSFVQGNVISRNRHFGVAVVSAQSFSNPILTNSIHRNGDLGIDLGPDGVTLNDPGDVDDGANGLQNYPVITRVAGITVEGRLNSLPGRYRIELFRNPGIAPCDPAAEGEIFLDSFEVTTDEFGNATFTRSLPAPVPGGDAVTATATSLDNTPNSTSEFSQCEPPRATIVVKKRTEPAGDPATFTFAGDIAGTIGDGETITVGDLDPDTYTATETVPSGWDLASITCDDGDSTGDVASATATFRVAAGETVTCTFTDTKRGKARVIKTVRGRTPSQPPGSGFVFQIRQGASTIASGTILESGEANASNGGVINFATTLVAQATYQLCETVMPGWNTTLGPAPFVVFDPSGDNRTLCANFSVSPGETKAFTVDNQPPPGGLARTIGFWKNWASCAASRGQQKPVLDQTLAAAEPAGLAIGTLTLHGSTTTPNAAPDCLKAVRLLSKSTIDTGKKMASDPAFNLAAQLLAAKLNVQAGALTCASAIGAINDAQALLLAVHFNGVTHDNLSPAQKSQTNSLAATLDGYSNNVLC